MEAHVVVVAYKEARHPEGNPDKCFYFRCPRRSPGLSSVNWVRQCQNPDPESRSDSDLDSGFWTLALADPFYRRVPWAPSRPTKVDVGAF
eukprot:1125156-Prorocentrum_minimum.AAC.1